jgi:hypothetical protein
MGMAALHPSPSSATARPNPKVSSSKSRSFYINKPSGEPNKAVAAPRPTLIHQQRSQSEHKLIFDVSDSRRALDDWELEDYVLVATIEGSLYALDRQSGATKWVLEGGGPAVQSLAEMAGSMNNTKGPWSNTEQQPRWIVQPVEGGQLFLFDEEFGVLVLLII